MTPVRAPRYRVGSRIGDDTTVLGILDDGGREPVYIVWHHRAWCPMACKVFRTAARARQEAIVLAALAHPNIVRPLGVGEPAHLLMEFLEGPTLRRLINAMPQHRLGISDALRVAIHLGTALIHMHERGFFHLDVKPRNVIVVRGRPVLFDFGTARPKSGWRRRLLEGTDPYMAPEQCRREPVTPATDVFGLGVTLYEMLAGRRPFPDGTRRRSFPQLNADPEQLRRHRPAVPRKLEGIVHQCLAHDPARRPSLAELLPDLHGLVRSGPPMWPAGFQPDTRTSARPDGAPHRPGRRGHSRSAAPIDPIAEQVGRCTAPASGRDGGRRDSSRPLLRAL
jgi:serine/threonine protein kinase